MDETAREATRRQFRELRERVATQREYLVQLKLERRDVGAVVSATELLEGMQHALFLLRQKTQADDGNNPLS